MKISGGMEEQGIVVGNAYDKYGSRNPIVKQIMDGFHRSLEDFVSRVGPQTIHEVGCGEGYWVMQWCNQGIQARGSDFSSQVIELARANAQEQQLAPEIFQEKSIYQLDPVEDSADLLVCCEVLEHLDDPEQGLRSLQGATQKGLIVSVPREPLWRLLNMVRGKYLLQAGNTPGHIQHWSRNSFSDMVQDYFHVVETSSPLPWTMLLCRPKSE